jgi:hypothetical protein
VLGALAGLLWSSISPHSLGFVDTDRVVANETEQFVGADARFFVITAAIGVAAGLVAFALVRFRGPVAVAALAVGGTLGALLTALVGHAVSSGVDHGKLGSAITLPITLHARGLLAFEGGLAVLAYLWGCLFIARDDLGRDEPGSAAPADGSVAAGRYVQRHGGDGDRTGFPQHGHFPTQQGDLGG